MRIHVVGDAFCDIVAAGLNGLPQWGGDVKANTIAPFAGGSALNTAVHIKGLLDNAQVYLHTALGESETDWATLVIQQHLVRSRVRLVAKRIPQTTTGVCIVLSGQGDRAFTTCNGAITYLSKQDFDVPKLADCDHIHFGGVFALTSLLDDFATLLQEIREANPKVTISLDTNYDATGKWGEHWLPEVLPLVDLIKLNDIEAENVKKTHATADETKDLPVQWLASRVRTAAVVTHGKDGAEFALASAPKVVTRIHGVSTDVVDPVGAGDAFNAGLIARWKENPENFEAAVQFACACGALNVTNIGACTVPVSQKGVDKFEQAIVASKRTRLVSQDAS